MKKPTLKNLVISEPGENGSRWLNFQLSNGRVCVFEVEEQFGQGEFVDALDSFFNSRQSGENLSTASEDPIVSVNGFSVGPPELYDYRLVGVTKNGNVFISLGDGEWLPKGPFNKTSEE